MPDIPSPPQDDALLYQTCKDALRMALGGVDPYPEQPDMKQRLLVALFSLPDRQHTSITMSLGAGYTQLEIAGHRGVSERTVRSDIYDGIRAIAERVF